MSSTTRPTRVSELAVIFWLIALSGTLAAAPEVTSVSLHGLQVGHATEITVRGKDLLPEPEVLLSVPITSQKLRDGARPNQITLELTVAASAAPGIYPLRVANAKGVSNSVAISVDALPSVAFSETIEALPVALNGDLTGSRILKTSFEGQQGQAIVVEVESRRLGANLRPVLRLMDSQGRQLAWSQGRRSIAGDARLELMLPEDGTYSIEMHDLLYRGAAPGHFRLKVGQLRYVDLAYPLGVRRGEATTLRLISTNILPTTLVEYLAPADGYGSDQPAVLPPIAALTGGQPRLVLSEHPELIESGGAGEQLQELSPPPVAINGRLEREGEEDRFLLPVQPGSKLRLDVLARRVGSPLDAVLAIRAEAGNQLAANDDRPDTSDPGLDFNVPENVSQVVVAIRDLLDRGGDDYLYRISVRDLGQPDFNLTVSSERLNISAGATQVLRLEVARAGYNGPIQLDVEGLPKDVQVQGTEIPAGATVGLLTLSAPQCAPVHGAVRIVGRGGQPPIVRLARAPSSGTTAEQPWLRDQVAMAVTEPGPLSVRWADDNAERPLLLGGKSPANVSIQRAEGSEGSVRLQLLTTQVMPKKTIKENNADKQVDDLDRALRLADAPMLDAAATQANLEVLVPPDLPQREWGLVLQAELLAADNKTVTATATTPVRYIKAVQPFQIELTSGKDVEAKAGMGETGTLTGKVHRVEGFAEAVTVTLAGLPDTYAAPQVTVPADQTDFTLPVSFAYGSQPAELKEAKLVASYQKDPNRPELAVRSNQIALGVIKVVPGEPPPAEKPYEIFEDDEKFVGYLASGGGQISLDAEDRHSGQVSIKVTPDQRYHESVPNLNLKIRENPGAGEYRYLRYAWKKKGGASICLQLNHDGSWGPGGSGKQGAKFRYHAGPGGECYGASITIDEMLPEQFTVVTRDLFADFGEFTFTGIALSPVDGEYALFDHMYLGRTLADFELAKPEEQQD